MVQLVSELLLVQLLIPFQIQVLKLQEFLLLQTILNLLLPTRLQPLLQTEQLLTQLHLHQVQVAQEQQQ